MCSNHIYFVFKIRHNVYSEQAAMLSSDADCERTPFSRFAAYGYGAVVAVYHGFHIEESQAVAFGIVQVSCGQSVELVEDERLLVGGDACAVVGDGDFYLPCFRL